MEAFAATCRSALDRMDESPEFIFTCSSAAHYRWIEETDPALFGRIQARAREGRWAIAGGWWVQADCNLPSGEGFARQALLGQRYFLERFGRIARTGYSPDAFGHNLGLPQLLARAGMTGYIYCRPDPTELHLPSPLVRWRGPDGSDVLAYRVPFHYNMYETSVPKKIADLAAAYERPSNLADAPLGARAREWMLMYGVGNHGGGPTRQHIAEIGAAAADPAAPSVRFSDPDTYLDSIARSLDTVTIPEWRDDLQLNAPGCYSADSAIKKLNRRAEHGLVVAERLSSLASILAGAPYPAGELTRAWEQVCFNHFHDILCGVAIREALDDAIAAYGEALVIAARCTRYAMRRLANRIDTGGAGATLVVFNPHSWEVARHVTFELWHDIDKSLWSRPVDLRVADDEGNEIPAQPGFTSGKIGKDRIAATFACAIPPLGWRCYRVFYGEKGIAPEPARGVRADGTSMENELVRVEIDPASGAVARIFHKGLGRELLAGPAGAGIAIDDPTDTWGHGVERFDTVAGRFGESESRLVASGPVFATIRTRSLWGGSWLQQDFTLRAGSDRIDVEVKLFWSAERTMLKLEFPALAEGPEAYYEGAYCAVRKPCDGIERPAGTWAAVVGAAAGDPGGEPAGIGIVSDAKYGYSATCGDGAASLMMTVLRSPSYATHDPHPFDPDEDLDFIDQGAQRFAYAIVPIAGADWRADLAREGALINAPLLPQLESAHDDGGDPLTRAYGGIEVEPATVAATVLKRAHDGDGWIVRLFETSGVATTATAHLGVLHTTWRGRLAPYEVVTILMRDGTAAAVSLAEIQTDCAGAVPAPAAAAGI
jgi:alpha-mannosidase